MRNWIVICILIELSIQCEDLAGSRCISILSSKGNRCHDLTSNEIVQCLRTCGACKQAPASQADGGKPPSWAYAPPPPKVPPGQNRKTPKSETEDSSSLPIYAVVLAVLAALAISVGVTVCVIKLKKKLKKRRIKKNHKLLMSVSGGMNTMRPNYMWGEGSYNGAYHHEMPADAWSRNMYLTGDMDSWGHQNQTLNNTLHTENRPNKNIDIIQNATKGKGRAPEPPQPEPIYKNLDNTMETVDKIKGPAPPPPTSLAVAVEYADCLPGEAAVKQESANNFAAPKESKGPWDEDIPPILPPRKSMTNEDSSKDDIKQNNFGKEHNVEEESADDSDEEESEASTVRLARTLSSMTEKTEHSSPALANILNEWKEHLQEQKRELEDYYKSLANYVKFLGLKPVGQDSNDQAMQQWLNTNQMEKVKKGGKKPAPAKNTDMQYASIHESYPELSRMAFPEPPESVRGDFVWEPNDSKSQKQVISDLRKKLATLQNLLESTESTNQEMDKKSQSLYIPSYQSNKHTSYQNKMASNNDRITIKVLLQRLGTRERTRVQMRIAQALDTSRKRGGMNIAPRDGPITCLCKQIHHVMTDILDPRTSTKIELGAHAARTLANRLQNNVHTNLLPVLRAEVPRQNVARSTESIALLTKQMLDMTKQLTTHESAFHSKQDYDVFVNAFVDTNEKIMDATFQLVCVIVDLQRAERRGVMKFPRQEVPSGSIPYSSLPIRVEAPRQRSQKEKEELLSRLHSESTSISVADVRQLNEDLGKLKQLLFTGGTLSALTGAEATQFHTRCDENSVSEFDHIPCDSECETMSTISCSTCMPENADSFFRNDAQPFRPPPDDRTKAQDKVQYTEVVPTGTFRPSTRPVRDADREILPAEMSPASKLQPMNMDMTSQAGSGKDGLRKSSTLDPSSFTSFHTDDEQSEVLQPRHQAMLARYFGEPAEPPKPEVAKPNEGLHQESVPRSAMNAATLPLPTKSLNSEVPMVTMLPCGLVANDTPPMTNPPKEKRIKLPRIPEITVLRNGAEESNKNKELGDHEPGPEINTSVEPDHHGVDEKASVRNEGLDDQYSSSDTLPISAATKTNHFETSDRSEEDQTPMEGSAAEIVQSSRSPSPHKPCSSDGESDLIKENKQDPNEKKTDKGEDGYFMPSDKEDIGFDDDTLNHLGEIPDHGNEYQHARDDLENDVTLSHCDLDGDGEEKEENLSPNPMNITAQDSPAGEATEKNEYLDHSVHKEIGSDNEHLSSRTSSSSEDNSSFETNSQQNE